MAEMDSVKGKKILVIGGGGFIGHHLVLRLAELGANVEVLDSLQVNNLLTFSSADGLDHNREFYLRMLNDRLELLRAAGVPLHIQDARDYYLLNKRLSTIKPDIIIHLAAVAHAGRSNKDPFSTFDHSLRTLENALDYARGTVERFVYFSSSMVYGNFRASPIREDAICEPIGIYGALKFSGEKMVIAYNQVFTMPYTIIRPSALYGERCVSRRVSQVFIENAVQGLGLPINGDGTDALDFTYIGDLVQGTIKTLGSAHAINQIFNITYGAARSIRDLAGVVQEYFPGIGIQRLPKEGLMPERGALSVERARRLCGYEPAYPLERGIGRYIEWYQAFVGLRQATPATVAPTYE